MKIIKIDCAAKANQNKEGLTEIKFQGYSGQPVDLSDYGFDAPVVYDIQNIEINKKIPILYSHLDPIGHTTNIRKVDNGKAIRGKGVLSIPGEKTSAIEESIKNGFPWQASMGLKVDFNKIDYITKGTVNVNGRLLNAPIYVVRKSRLEEMSITPFGRDNNTSFTLSKEDLMRIKNMATGQTVYDDQKGQQVQNDQQDQQTQQVQNDQQDQQTQPTPPPVNTGTLDNQTRRAMRLLNKFPGEWEIIEKGIDNGWDDEAIENTIRLKNMNSSLPTPPKPFDRDKDSLLKEKVRMALAVGVSPKFLEKKFGDKIVNQAYEMPTASIRELLVKVANANGGSFTGISDVENLCRHIKNAGFSTFDLPNFFESIAEFVKEERWEINPPFAPKYCKPGSNNNFNKAVRYRPTGGDMWNQVQNDGKLEIFSAGDQVRYVADLETYGTVITFDRETIVNDDMGVVQDLIDMMVEGAKMIPDYQLGKLLIQKDPAPNSFWVDDDNSFDNTPLTRSNLSTLYNKVRQYQESKERFQWNVMINLRWTLITSPSLEEAAWEILQQSQIVQETGAASGTKTGSRNYWFGRMDQDVFPQMENTSAFGSSSKFVGPGTWILWPSNNQFAPYEITYLQNRRTPTIEPVDLPATILGFGLRGYWDVKINERERTAVIRATATA